MDAETIEMEWRIFESNSSERPIFNTGCSLDKFYFSYSTAVEIYVLSMNFNERILEFTEFDVWLWISEILKVWQEINLMDEQNIVMNTTKIQGSDPR